MERYWFFTWRTYGTWLPGAPGFVGNFVTPGGQRVTENAPNTPTADPMPPLERYAASLLRREPVLLNHEHAAALLAQFHAHAAHRGWALDAVAILTNHVHIVFGVPGDPDPKRTLDDWKAYASRPLNRLAGWTGDASAQQRAKRDRGRPVWWERDGSTRRLKLDEHRVAAVRYVREQERPLVVWVSKEAESLGEP